MLKTEPIPQIKRSKRKYLWWDIGITLEIVGYFTLLTVIFILERKIAIIKVEIANHIPRTTQTFIETPAVSTQTQIAQIPPEKEAEPKSRPFASFKESKAQPNQAALYYQQGQVPKAIAQYQKLLETQPQNAEFHLTLGQMYMSTPQFTGKAIEHLQKTLKLQPRHPRKRNIELWVEQLQKRQELILQQQQKMLATFKKHREAKIQPHGKK